MTVKVPLSVAVITKNEEGRLADCLRSVSFADDIVVVDSGSTDGTVGMAKGFGCRVFIEDWKGYGPQKQSAIDKCRHEWALVLDADERIPPETALEISGALKNPAFDAYSFPRKNYLHGRWIKHSDWWPDRVVRLVKKNTGSFDLRLHEGWRSGTPSGRLESPIEHFSFSTYSDMLGTLDEYSSAAAKELHLRGVKANILDPLWHGAGMFFKIYFLKRGFTGGLDGLVIALTKAGGSFFKYAKLLEIERQSK